MAFLPPVSLLNRSAHTSDTNLANQPVDTQNPNTTPLHSSSLISSSSSAGSSTVPSPGLTNIDANSQHSWPSGASKVARVANKIVNSINSVSTPKSSRKPPPPQLTHTPPASVQLSQNSPKIFFSNESQSSSCNSSGPNSPSYFKLQQQQLALQDSANKARSNNTDKKSSSSSISISSGSNPQQQRNSFFNYTAPSKIATTLSPISGNNNASFSVNPTIKRTTSVDSNQLDGSSESLSMPEQSEAVNGEVEVGERGRKEALDVKMSNNSTVVDSNYDGETDLENTNMNYSEYEGNEQEMNQLNVCKHLRFCAFENLVFIFVNF